MLHQMTGLSFGFCFAIVKECNRQSTLMKFRLTIHITQVCDRLSEFMRAVLVLRLRWKWIGRGVNKL